MSGEASGIVKGAVEDAKQSIRQSFDQARTVLRLIRRSPQLMLYYIGAVLSVFLSGYMSSETINGVLSAQNSSVPLTFLLPLVIAVGFLYSLFLIYTVMNAVIASKSLSQLDTERESITGLGVLWSKKKSIIAHSLLRPLLWVAPGKIFVLQSLLGLSESKGKDLEGGKMLGYSFFNNPLRRILFFFFPALADSDRDDIRSVIEVSDDRYRERFGSSKYGFVDADIVLLPLILIGVLLTPVTISLFQSLFAVVITVISPLFLRLAGVAIVRTAYFIPEEHLEENWAELTTESDITS